MQRAILLSVRSKATRFPGKVLKPFGAHANVTEHLLRSLRTSRLADHVVIATSTDPRDAIFEPIAEKEQVACFRGSPEDKLLRYRDYVLSAGIDTVVIVDGDDPFCSVPHVDRIFETLAQENADFVTFEGLPLGVTGFGLSKDALIKVCENRPEADTEVWGSMFVNRPDRYKIVILQEENPAYRKPELRLTLDYPEDYDLFSAIVAQLEAAEKPVDFHHAMQLLAEQPALAAMNQAVHQAWLDNIAKIREKMPSSTAP